MAGPDPAAHVVPRSPAAMPLGKPALALVRWPQHGRLTLRPIRHDATQQSPAPGGSHGPRPVRSPDRRVRRSLRQRQIHPVRGDAGRRRHAASPWPGTQRHRDAPRRLHLHGRSLDADRLPGLDRIRPDHGKRHRRRRPRGRRLRPLASPRAHRRTAAACARIGPRALHRLHQPHRHARRPHPRHRRRLASRIPPSAGAAPCADPRGRDDHRLCRRRQRARLPLPQERALRAGLGPQRPSRP